MDQPETTDIECREEQEEGGGTGPKTLETDRGAAATLEAADEVKVEEIFVRNEEKEFSEDSEDVEKGKKKEDDATEIGEGLEAVHSNGLVDQTAYLPTRQVITIFSALTAVIMLSFLDQTIVSTALPKISAAFNDGRSASWVSASYLMTSTAIQPTVSRLSDIFGRKAVLLASVVIFIVFSLGCALSQTMMQLIIFRAFQGVGGGAGGTIVMITMGDIVSLKDRGKYQGIIEAVIALSNGVGPIIGGVLAQKTTWRWCFYINLPAGCLCLAVLVLFLPLKPVKGNMIEKLKRIDYLGSLLVIGAATMTILALNWGGVTFPWISGRVLGCFLAGFVVAVLFVAWELYGASLPVIPFRAFRTVNTWTLFVITFNLGIIFISAVYYLPQYLQVVKGKSPIRSSLLTLPFLVTLPIVVILSGLYISRSLVYKPIIVFGFIVLTAIMGVLSIIDENTSDSKFMGLVSLISLGLGTTIQTSLVACQASVPHSEMSSVVGMRSFFRLLGNTMGLSICQVIINATFKQKLSADTLFTPKLIVDIIDAPTSISRIQSNTPQDLLNLTDEQKASAISAYVAGFRTLFYFFTAIAGFNLLLSVFLMKNLSVARDTDEAMKKRGHLQHLEMKERKKARKAK